jgi:hypothetical protein
VDAKGYPCAPSKAATRFITQCGDVVRRGVPIPQDWKTKNPEEQHHAVPPQQKEMLWRELRDMFTLSEGVEEELVKKFALKKMALAFATFKKILFGNFINKDVELNWDKLPQVKPYWEELKEYKLSKEAQELSKKNKINAAAMKYNHRLGPGWYRKAIRKWRKME